MLPLLENGVNCGQPYRFTSVRNNSRIKFEYSCGFPPSELSLSSPHASPRIPLPDWQIPQKLALFSFPCCAKVAATASQACRNPASSNWELSCNICASSPLGQLSIVESIADKQNYPRIPSLGPGSQSLTNLSRQLLQKTRIWFAIAAIRLATCCITSIKLSQLTLSALATVHFCARRTSQQRLNQI
jgi:hypothetical protein